MISTPDRLEAVLLIDEAVSAGARKARACHEAGITLRTLQRWRQEGAVKFDGRPVADRAAPPNKLSQAERAEVLAVANTPRFTSLPPTQIVPILADEGRYVASESSFYRILREEDQQHHRGRAASPQARVVPRNSRERAQSVVGLGHHLLASPDHRDVLLPLPRARCVLPQDRGARGARGGVVATRRAPDRMRGGARRSGGRRARPAPGQRQSHEGLDLRCQGRGAGGDALLQPTRGQ